MGQAKLRQHVWTARPAEGPGAARPRGSLWFNGGVFILLLAAGLVAYHNAFWSPFIWDDPYLVTENYLVTSFRYLPDIFTHHLYHSTAGLSNFYRPLQTFFLMVDYAIWKTHPFGYHLTSFLFHVLCGWLAFLTIDELFHRRGIAALVSLLFIVHPINSTVVDYIASRADAQAALFMLVSVWLFVVSCRRGQSSRLGLALWLGSLVAFALALLSKELAMVFPALLTVLMKFQGGLGPSIRPSAGSGLARDSARRAMPMRLHDRTTASFWCLLGAYALLRLTVLNFPSAMVARPPALWTRLLTTGEAWVRLIGLMVVPREIHIEKSIPFSPGWFDPGTILSFMALVGIGVFMGWVRRRSPVCFFGLAWFFLCLLPMSNVVPINTTLADHWLYLPGIGFLLAVIGGVADGVKRLRPSASRIASRCFLGLYAVILSLFSALTVKQNRIWRDPKQFFQLALRYSPDSFRAHNELGVIVLDEGKFQDAVAEFQAAVHLNPQFDQAYDNLGIAYDHLGRLDDAIAAHRHALRLNPANPKIYNNLGNAYFKAHQLEDAIEAYRAALALNPHYLAVYNNLGAVYYQQGRREEARRIWEQALAIYPQAPSITQNLQLLRQDSPADHSPRP